MKNMKTGLISVMILLAGVAWAMLPMDDASETVVSADQKSFKKASEASENASSTHPAVRSVVVVFKEAAVTKGKDGKSAQDKADFKKVKNQKKLFETVKKSKKDKSGKKALSKAGRNLKNAYKYELEEGEELGAALAELKASPLVEYAEPDVEYQLLAMPNDTHISEQWSLNNTGQTFHDTLLNSISGTSGADINWKPAYEAGLPTNEIVVAVVDTGVDYTHADMVNQMWVNPGEIADNGIDDDSNGYIDDVRGYDMVNADSDPMDDHLHGTHVAGTIAAQGDNNYGMIGVNPNAKIMAVKIFKADGSGATVSVVVPAIKYAAENGAQVMNNSWGGTSYSELIEDAVAYATELGCLFVAAAGNSNMEGAHYPSAYPGSMSVAATDKDDGRAYFSNYDPTVDVSAPGHYIFSLLTSMVPDPKYGKFDNDFLIISGTSMACPTAAGAASLLVAKYPGFTPWVYQKVMQATCESSNFYTINSNYVGKLGAGRIRVNEALNYTNEMAFLSSYVNLKEGYGRYFLAPGEGANMAIKVATWLHDLTNLSVRVTAVTADISVSEPSTYVLGELSGYSETNLPDSAFTVTLDSDAEWNTDQKVRVELLNGSDVLVARTNSVQVYDGQLYMPVIYDLDDDGSKETVGTYGETVSTFDAEGHLKWFYAAPVSYSAGDVVAGDVDGDGKGEVVFMATLVGGFGSAADRKIYVLEDDGTLKAGWPRDVWTNRFDYNSAAYSFPPRLGDMDGDGNLDIITLGLGSDYKPRYVVLDGAGSIMASYTSTNTASAPSAVSIADIDGDGTNEVVCFEQRVFVTSQTRRSLVRIFDNTLQPIRSWMMNGEAYQEGGEVKSGTVANQRFAPVLADVDADGLLDIITISYFDDAVDSMLCVWNQDGTWMPGFPRMAFPYKANRMPDIADVDGDGDLEIASVSVIFGLPSLVGWDHEGNLLPHFPITAPELDQDFSDGLGLSLANVDDDADPEMVYIGDYEISETTDDYTYKLYARDFRDGLMVRGFPVLRSGENGYTDPPLRLLVDAMSGSEFGTNAQIISSAGSEIHTYDTGYPFVESAQHWPSYFHDAQRANAHNLPVPGNLTGGFGVDGSVEGVGSYSATFHSDYSASSSSSVYYRWDFDGDNVTDDEGYGKDAPTHNYDSNGTYTVTMTLSNDVGEVCTRTREDYITVYSNITADFSASATNNINAPIRITFTDESGAAARSWMWEVDEPSGGTHYSTFSDGSASSNQNPTLDLTQSGTYTIRLTASCDFGPGGSDSDSTTREVVVGSVVANATNHYVWAGGRHLYPFKNWDEAATNIQAAADAALNGEHVIVTNGTYLGGALVEGRGVHFRSVNGPYVTIIDGQNSAKGLGMQSDLFMSGALNSNYSGSAKGFTIQNCYDMVLTMRNADFLAEDMILKNNLGMIDFYYSRMNNCLIQSNENVGTVLFVSEGSMSNCVIQGNSGIAEIAFAPHSQLHNCLFVGNNGDGRILHTWLGTEIRNSTFANNVVRSDPDFPNGVIYPGKGNFTMLFDNSIIYGNVKEGGGRPKDFNFKSNEAYDKRVAVRNSCYTDNISWLPSTYKTNTLIGVNPKFVDAANGNYRLQSSSQCLDAGYMCPRGIGDLTRTFLIDFGPSATLTTGYWNNVTNVSSGLKIDNMKDDTGASSSYDLSFLDDFESLHDDGNVASNLYPSTAQRDTIRSALAPQDTWTNSRVQISNLNTSNIYELVFFGSIPDRLNNGKVKWTGRNWSYLTDAEDGMLTNTSVDILIPDVTAPAGTIVVEVQNAWTSHSGSMGVMELREYAYDGRSTLTNTVDLDGRGRVYNDIVDMGPYELHDNDLPVISIHADASEGLTPFAVAFTAVVSDVDGTITNIQWNFGDGSVSNGAGLTTIAHTYPVQGHYQVDAIATDNDGGSQSDSMTVIASDDVFIAAPTNFTAVNLSPTNNFLSWEDMSDNETSFEIRRRIYTNYWEQIVDDEEGIYAYDWEPPLYFVGTNATAYGGTYRYGDAEMLDGYMMSMDLMPDLLPADAMYEIFEWHPVVTGKVTEIASTWVNSPDGRIMLVVDQTVNGGQWNSIGVHHLAPGSTLTLRLFGIARDTLIDAFKFVRVAEFETIASLPPGTTNYTDSNLIDDRIFEYELAARNTNGDSDWVTAWATIPPTNIFPEATILSASPTNGRSALLVSATGEGSDADGTITNYFWDFGDNYSGSQIQGPNQTNAQYIYHYDGTYTLTLTVTDDQGYSSTNTAEVVVTVQESAPNAPSGLYAQSDMSSITLHWTDNAFNEDIFVLQRKEGDGAFSALGTVETPSTVYQDTQVSLGSVYTYRVAASNEQGRSDWSNEEIVFFGNAEDYELPFMETFEASPTNMAGTLGALNGQHGWVAEGPSSPTPMHRQDRSRSPFRKQPSRTPSTETRRISGLSSGQNRCAATVRRRTFFPERLRSSM